MSVGTDRSERRNIGNTVCSGRIPRIATQSLRAQRYMDAMASLYRFNYNRTIVIHRAIRLSGAIRQMSTRLRIPTLDRFLIRNNLAKTHGSSRSFIIVRLAGVVETVHSDGLNASARSHGNRFTGRRGTGSNRSRHDAPSPSMDGVLPQRRSVNSALLWYRLHAGDWPDYPTFVARSTTSSPYSSARFSCWSGRFS